MFVWTGSSWTPVVPAHQPVARSEESVAYDSRTHQLILFGGNIHGANDPAADTWEWSGTDWVQLAPATSPSARAGATMAYDDATGQLVLTGGRGAGLQQLADTWVWTGTTWKQLVPKTSPGMFWAGTATFDPALDALVLFGGPLAPLGTPAGINQMWKWTGSNWQLIPTAVSPSDVASPTMAYDTATAQLVLMAPNRDKVDAFHTLMLVASPTKTTLTAATSTVVAGQPVSIVAKVAAKQVAVPGGSVTFTDDNVTIPGCAGVAVVGGSATCTYSPANGAPKVRAQYGPMAGFLASSARVLTLTVG